MEDEQKEQISQALHDGLYALLDTGEVSRTGALDSIRQAIYLVNDEWGIETGYRPDPDPAVPDAEGVQQEIAAEPHYPLLEPNVYPAEYRDQATDTWAAITETELVVLAGYGMKPEDTPRRFRSADIESVKLAAVPGEFVTVCVRMPGVLVDPCPKFGSLSYALDFADHLRAAAG